MKTFLLTLGAGPLRALPPMFSAFCCGAVPPPRDGASSHLSVFSLCSSAESTVLPSLVQDLNVCHRLFSSWPESGLFPRSFSWASCPVDLPVPDRSSPSVSALLDALRGKGVPLSPRTDREAAEWAFSALLSAPEEGALSPFLRWLEGCRPDSAGEDVRLLLLADPADAFSCGLTLALLPDLRRRFAPDPPFLGLLLVPALPSGEAEARSAVLSGALRYLLGRNLLRRTEGRDTEGADAAWLLGLPSSLTGSPDIPRIIALAAARVLAGLCSPRRPTAGLHTLSLPAALRFRALGEETVPTMAFLRTSVWFLSDILPSLKGYLARPAGLRSLAPNTRGGLFRRLFRREDTTVPTPPELETLERTLKALLTEVLSLISTLPDPLRLPERNQALWKDATAACGRWVTLASELDVSRAEARASGVDQVKPVHRVSLEDTEEEQLLHRLDDMAEQLGQEKKERTRLLSLLGGYRAFQVLADCRARCETALGNARVKLQELSSAPGTDALTLGLQERRIRLLEAAVLRCDKDLRKAFAYPALAAHPADPVSASEPWAGVLLSPAAAESLRALILCEGAPDEAEKALRAHLPDLFAEYPLGDMKALLRDLLALCRPQEALSPLCCLFGSMLAVCREETAALRMPPPEEAVPDLPLLPDLRGDQPLNTPEAILSRFPLSNQPEDPAGPRGLLAFLLLSAYRRPESGAGAVSAQALRDDGSPVLHCWLAGNRCAEASLLSLTRGEESFPLALILPGRELIPARFSAGLFPLLPSWVTFADAEHQRFLDPNPYLGESDRLILTDVLDRLVSALKAPESEKLASFLSAFAADLRSSSGEAEDDGTFSSRLLAACGLPELPAWRGSLKRRVAFYEHALPRDPVAALLSGDDAFPAASCAPAEEVLYTWKGIPFARESSTLLLEGLRVPEEKSVLSTLDTECRILFRSSDDFREALTRSLPALLRRCPEALPGRREEAEKWLRKAEEPVSERITELTWPWDEASPSVRTILEECLGPELAAAAILPFSDWITIFPARSGDIIGDALFSRMCTLQPATAPREGEDEAPPVAPDTLLPPLHPAFARALCCTPRGQALPGETFLAFERLSDGALRATLTLEGNFSLRLRKTWPADKILSLYSFDMPTLAVWPSVPFAPEQWHAYLIYAHLPESLRLQALLSADQPPLDLEPEGSRALACLPALPTGFLLFRGEESAGALPNLLPAPTIEPRGAFRAAVDFGSSASSVVLSGSSGPHPLQGPVLVRTLLNNPASSAELLRREFLPAVPVSALLPATLRLLSGRDPLRREEPPMASSVIYMPAGPADVLSRSPARLRTAIKWEGADISAPYLLQLMLLIALHARWEGAEKLSWLFALPDGMAREGRERLCLEIRTQAEKALSLAGFPPEEGVPPVQFAAESAALGAYFRFCLPAETQGGFLVLNLGACDADLSLFLRSLEKPVRSCQLPLGIQHMLLPSLLRRPDLLTQDFAFVQDEAFQKDLDLFSRKLRDFRTDPEVLRLLRPALDMIIEDHFALFCSALLQRRLDRAPAQSGSLLLLHLSFLMMLSGLQLLQLAVDPEEGDFLPPRMTLCLAGRGSVIPESLPDDLRAALWRFLTMFRNPRVSSVPMVFAADKKQEIPVGLTLLESLSPGVPETSAPDPLLPVRPEELLPEFLLRFRREFPAESELLFPGIFANDYFQPFTPRGIALLQESLAAAFTDRLAGRPFDALAAWIAALPDILERI